MLSDFRQLPFKGDRKQMRVNVPSSAHVEDVRPGLSLQEVFNVSWRDHANTHRPPARLQAPYPKEGFASEASSTFFMLMTILAFLRLQN